MLVGDPASAEMVAFAKIAGAMNAAFDVGLLKMALA
jgi:hypothetical protein